MITDKDYPVCISVLFFWGGGLGIENFHNFAILFLCCYLVYLSQIDMEDRLGGSKLINFFGNNTIQTGRGVNHCGNNIGNLLIYILLLLGGEKNNGRYQGRIQKLDWGGGKDNFRRKLIPTLRHESFGDFGCNIYFSISIVCSVRSLYLSITQQ